MNKLLRYEIAKASIASEDELYHHGVLGMKWGVRRYQPYGEGGYNPKTISKIHETAKRKEPTITKDVHNASLKAGSKLYGLEHRLKTPDSINRKIAKSIQEDAFDLKQATSNIKDALRYTTISDEKTFVHNYNRFKEEMRNLGYEEMRCKNYFQLYNEGKVKHKAVQSVFSDKDGYLFEVQFQTPKSQQVKELKVPLYEERRKVGISKAKAKDLEKQMEKLAESVDTPDGIDSIKTYNRIKR